jgi:hypothetical protein
MEITFSPPILLIVVLAGPFMVLNGMISKRKGKNQTKYILLSIIPYLGIFLALYLISFLDKDIEDKINALYKK